jgi:hypothetical protein
MSLIRAAAARLLALERKQARAADELRDLRRELVAIQQGIWDSWSDFKMRTQPPGAPATNCTFHGNVQTACGGVTGGIHVDLSIQTTGVPLGTFTSDASGNIDGSVYVPGSVNVNFLYHAPNVRYVDQTQIVNLYPNPGTITLSGVTLQLAANMHCVSICANPLKFALTCHDSHTGLDVAMNYNALSNQWFGTSSGFNYILSPIGTSFQVTGLGGYGTLTRTSATCWTPTTALQFVYDKSTVPVTCTITEV